MRDSEIKAEFKKIWAAIHDLQEKVTGRYHLGVDLSKEMQEYPAEFIEDKKENKTSKLKTKYVNGEQAEKIKGYPGFLSVDSKKYPKTTRAFGEIGIYQNQIIIKEIEGEKADIEILDEAASLTEDQQKELMKNNKFIHGPESSGSNPESPTKGDWSNGKGESVSEAFSSSSGIESDTIGDLSDDERAQLKQKGEKK